jgi:hypothetical protein
MHDADNSTERTVALRNMDPPEILRQAAYLRGSAGRKASLRVKQRTQTRRPSVQGAWTPDVQDALKQQS